MIVFNLIGYYSAAASAKMCLACNKGQHQLETGQSYCLNCESGKYQTEVGQANCLECPAGFFCPDITGLPVVCPTNAFCPKNVAVPLLCNPLFLPNNVTQASGCSPDSIFYVTVAISVSMAILIIASLSFAIGCRIYKNRLLQVEEGRSLLPSMRRPVKNPDYQGL